MKAVNTVDENDVYQSVKDGPQAQRGTYAHPLLVMAFAQHLSPDFAVAGNQYDPIDGIIFTTLTFAPIQILTEGSHQRRLHWKDVAC